MGFTFAIGDIHGCNEQLGQLLDALEMSWPGGRIVFLGDYVDRGPDSKGVIDRLMAGPTKPGWQWLMLKGNHEEMMVSALRLGKDVSRWFENGGQQTFDSFSDSFGDSFDGSIADTVLDWMDALPVIDIGPHRIFVHAGVDETLALERQSSQTLLWSRPSAEYDHGYWGRHLCHGHTPSGRNPETIVNRTNIDSGCVFGGSLTAAVFDDMLPGPPVRFVSIANRNNS